MFDTSFLRKFGRVLVPLVTPFNEDDSVNYEGIKLIVDTVIKEDNCDSLIVSGTTGEFQSLTVEERIELFKAVYEGNNGRVPLIAGTGAVYLPDAIKLSKEAEKIGYDAIMVVAPYYCHPSQEGLYEHYKAVADSVSIPVMIYNIPLFSGENVSAETLERLVKDTKNIRGIKEEAGINPLQSTEYAIHTEFEPEFTIYSGDDLMILPVLAQGGVGVVSGGGHVVGKIIKRMINNYFDGNVIEANKDHKVLYKFFTSLFGPRRERVNPTPLVKAVHEIASGQDVTRVRMPLLRATDEEMEFLKGVVEETLKS